MIQIEVKTWFEKQKICYCWFSQAFSFQKKDFHVLKGVVKWLMKWIDNHEAWVQISEEASHLPGGAYACGR